MILNREFGNEDALNADTNLSEEEKEKKFIKILETIHKKSEWRMYDSVR